MTDFLKKEYFKNYCKAVWRLKALAIALCVSILAIIYWGVIASDRYVSEARVLIQRTDMAALQALDFGSLLAGGTESHVQIRCCCATDCCPSICCCSWIRI